ncbi:hypothetical protein [Chitinibacter tainanensis]|uniref:hypothetical protein n=1 Tax=Chitinibacter tainanensis TaxID=230667 RepID=UPI0004261B1F|nr:hypothetical protein [Chitinibacter tainanensis]
MRASLEQIKHNPALARSDFNNAYLEADTGLTRAFIYVTADGFCVVIEEPYLPENEPDAAVISVHNTMHQAKFGLISLLARRFAQD